MVIGVGEFESVISFLKFLALDLLEHGSPFLRKKELLIKFNRTLLDQRVSIFGKLIISTGYITRKKLLFHILDALFFGF